MKNLLFIILLLLSLGSAAQTTGIVNPTVSTYELTVEEARLVYLARKQFWDTGERIQLFFLPREHPATRYFAYEHLGIPPSYMFDIITYLGGTQKSDKVQVLAGEAEMLRTISRTPGSIGYISNYVVYNSGSDVRKLRIR